MPKKTTLNAMKKWLMPGVFATALTALIGFQATEAAAQAERLWSVVVHFEYDNGFEYDYMLAAGVSAANMAAILAECGSSHWTGSVVRYHCYPIPE
jgi:hypothetical protein